MSRSGSGGIVFGGLIAAVLAAATIASAATQSRQPTLPSSIDDELTKAYPGWRFARIHPQLVAELEGDDGVRRSPEWVFGDYNQDGRRDYAVRIVRPETGDSTQLILAFLAKGRGYERAIVDAGRSEHLGIYLRTARRGLQTRDYDRDPSGEKLFVLRSDALVISFQSAAITCVYEARRWRCFQSAD